MRAFVTGGSGFLGRQLLRDLVARGYEARALSRSEAAATVVGSLGAKTVPGDLDDETALAAGMSGCDVVFHAAAKVGVWGRREDFERSTIAGTRNALRAARAAGVRRFVHVSTEAVLVGGPPLRGADETWPLPTRPLGLYPWSKGEAERLVQSEAATGLEAVIVRPRAIWGADDTVILPRLCAMVDTGKFAWIGGGHALTSTCHVKNVVAGMFAAAERGRPGEAYFLRDDDDVTYREFLGGQLARLGRDVERSPTLPLGVARVAAPVCEAYWRMTGRTDEPPLTRTSVELIGTEITVRDAKARRELGYAPVIDRAGGLAEFGA